MICESSGFSDEWEKIVRVQHIKMIFSVSMLIVLQEINFTFTSPIIYIDMLFPIT